MPNFIYAVLENIESGEIIEIDKSPFTIGRGVLCDYVIANKVVSRTHCSLERTDDGWILRDSSTNGTLVNEEIYQAEESPILQDDDEICLGFHTYTYRFLMNIERVPNPDVERRISEERAGTPGSPFDENGVSDEVLNNLADGILHHVEEDRQPSGESKEAAEKDENIQGDGQISLQGTPVVNIEDELLESDDKQPLPSTSADSIDQTGIVKLTESSTSEENSQKEYQYNRIIDPIHLMLQSPQSSTSQTEGQCKNPDFQQNMANDIEECVDNISRIANLNLDHVNETTGPLEEQKEADSVKNTESHNLPNTIQITSTDESSSSANTITYSLPDDFSTVLSSHSNPDLNRETKDLAEDIPDTLPAVDAAPQNITTTEGSSILIEETSGNTKQSDSQSSGNTITLSLTDAFWTAPSSRHSNLDLNRKTHDIPLTLPAASKNITATEGSSMHVASSDNNTKQSNLLATSHVTADPVERFRINFAETLDEVVAKYTVDLDSVISSAGCNITTTASKRPHSGDVTSNRHLGNISTNANYCTSTTPSLKYTSTIPGPSTSSLVQNTLPPASLSVASSSNSKKKVKVMKTRAPAITVAHSAASSSRATRSNPINNQKVVASPSAAGTSRSVIKLSHAKLQKLLGPQNVKSKNIPMTAVTNATSAKSSSAKRRRVIIVKPNTIPAAHSLTPSNNAARNIIQPEHVREAVALSMHELNVRRGMSLNHTVTTGNTFINTPGCLANTIVSLPGTAVNVINSAHSTCLASTAVTDNKGLISKIPTQNVDTETSRVDYSGGIHAGDVEMLESQALPVAYHETVVSTECADHSKSRKPKKLTSPIKYHDSQEPGTSKAPPKEDLSKQQNQCLDQNQYEEMENELMCTICANLFIKTVTLGCSHSFCDYCIKQWRKKKSDCPICRSKIASSIRTLVLDNVIEKMLESATAEDKKQREQAVDERRKIEESQIPAKKRKTEKGDRNTARRGRRHVRTNTAPPAVAALPRPPTPPPPPPAPVINLVDSPSTTDNDDTDNSDYDYDGYYGDDWYNGRRGAYYGGYGRCYNCGDPGHWSNGCPYR